MKKWLALLLTACLACTLLLTASAETLGGTLIRSGTADRWILYHNGMYYLTQTGTSRVAVFESDTLAGFQSQSIENNIVYKAYHNGTVYDSAVVELFGKGETISGTWSPEIHYFSAEDFGAEYAGWYMFVALRQTIYKENSTTDLSSEVVRLVILKSTTDSPKGPYGHPTTGEENCSQPLLMQDGEIYDEWGCGQSILRISEGPYKGIYATWVAEEGRGSSGTDGTFHQKLMIAQLENPWTLASEPAIITTPTQEWEYAGASSTHARVVEGGTAVYGIHGEVFLTYSGSGYWSDYGLGQLTWTGGDPLETSSWVKLPNKPTNGAKTYNPIFQAKTALNLRGAGHASFITDKDGNGYLCYHAYAYTGGKKAAGRDAYIEPYYIDYTEWNGTSYGVIHMGLTDTRMPASTSSTVTFASEGETLGSATVTVAAENGITLTMNAENVEGYTIYRSTDGKTFELLTTTTAATYLDDDTAQGEIYYYRVYPYRGEEIGTVSATVSGKPADDYKLLDVLRLLRYMNGENMPVYSTDDRNNDAQINLADVLSTLQHVLNG